MACCFLEVCLGSQITASEGERVILPCTLKPRGTSTLIWMYCGEVKNVLKVKGDQVVERAHSRVDTFLDKHSTGNLSIQILNVTVNDTGCYECHLQPEGLQMIVKLNVTEIKRKKEDNSQVQPAGGAVVPQLSACVLMLVMSFLFM